MFIIRERGPAARPLPGATTRAVCDGRFLCLLDLTGNWSQKGFEYPLPPWCLLLTSCLDSGASYFRTPGWGRMLKTTADDYPKYYPNP